MKLFIRREPTNDPQILNARRSKHYTDLVGYHEAECNTEVHRWRWYADDKPKKVNPFRKNTSNTVKLGQGRLAIVYQIEWLPAKLLDNGKPCYP